MSDFKHYNVDADGAVDLKITAAGVASAEPLTVMDSFKQTVEVSSSQNVISSVDFLLEIRGKASYLRQAWRRMAVLDLQPVL